MRLKAISRLAINRVRILKIPKCLKQDKKDLHNLLTCAVLILLYPHSHAPEIEECVFK